VAGLLKRLRRQYLYPWLEPRLPYRQATFAGIRVHYKKHLDGGGRTFGQGFVPFLQSRGTPTLNRAFEWCAGPGFIGFSLLGHGLCRTLCLADVNPDAIEACNRTIADNALTDRVSVYRSDNLKSIARTERWDLVVANPPHFADAYAGELRCHDPDWRIHREFFQTVAPFLTPSGVIVLQENTAGSTADTFAEMIAQAGLTIVFVQWCPPQRTPDHRFYYIGIMRAGAAVPAWARQSAASPPGMPG
jgi:predicted RNA methylase